MNWGTIWGWHTVPLPEKDVAQMDQWVEHKVHGHHAVSWILEKCIQNIQTIGV